MAFLELRKVAKRFGSHEVIPPLDLAIEKGEFVVFVGPSGCGKSTLMRLIAGLEPSSDGEIWIDGRDVTDVLPKDRDIAMVFQNYALYPDKSVYDNMAFGLRMRKTPAREVDERVRAAARVLGLDALLERRPAQLSGGQRQRVAVGRAMVREPKIFLFDEPLSNLDAHLRVHMRTELVRLHRQLGATMIYVTHDQVEAMTMGDRIVVLDHGRIRQAGAPLELFRRPANAFVAGFIGSPAMNMLPCVVEQHGTELRSGPVTIPVPPPLRAALKPWSGKAVLFGLRPQFVGLAAAPGSGTLRLTLDAVEHLGTETILIGLHEGRPFQVVVPTMVGISAGSSIFATLDAGRGHVFDAATGDLIAHGSDVDASVPESIAGLGHVS
ncbi:ABC transporter ATP-binding protein [Arenibaculum pallidiluteum]|uniref:ABC transporter ATP-binding protein n=1 Tax=Arenibaculum pallidiluteum TaxID=2812559 RepID=UPI001A977B06|nr:sn-glycerol-3-phosphate ABC transporter ATP-binding protein UgpC [Arenibaculum pallidiluteum]